MKAYRVWYDEFSWIYVDPTGNMTNAQIKEDALAVMYPGMKLPSDSVQRAVVEELKTFGRVISLSQVTES